jgi:hypothetical protein
MKVAITVLVAVHFLIAVWHGQAHTSLGVTLSPGQFAFVFGVIVLAPFVAALLIWTHRLRTGTWVFFLSMVGSFLFGTYHHYVAVSADHVQHLPNGSADARSVFIASAAALALVEFGSALYGAFCLRGTGCGARRMADGRSDVGR